MRRFLLASVATLAAIVAVVARFGADHQGRDAFRREGARSGVERRLHHAQPRLHDLRHAVCDRREAAGQAADGRQLDDQRRRAHLDLQAARWPRMARRHAGHVGGLRGLAQALVGARFDGPEARAVGSGLQDRRSQDLPDRAQAEVRAAPGGHRQAVGDGALHDAEEDRGDRCLHPDRQLHRLRPVHLQEGRMEAGREAGLRQEPQIQAARRADVGACRRQGGERRPGRVGVDSRPRDPAQRAGERRNRHDRERELRPPAGAGEEQEHPGDHRAPRPTSTCSA